MRMSRGLSIGVMGLAVVCLESSALRAQATVPNPASTAPAASPSDSLEARYAPLLHALKSPSATGVLITELQPFSSAAAAGLRIGDIVTFYNGHRVETETGLQEAVADAAAESVRKSTAEAVAAGGPLVARVVVQVRRGVDRGEIVSVEVATGGMGITLREVAAGVAVRSNPPATEREKLVLEWAKVPAASDDGAREEWFRLYDGFECTGFERRSLRHQGERWTVATTTWMVADGKVVEEQQSAVECTAGDNQTSPPVQIDTLRWHGYGQTVQAQRKGLVVRGTITSGAEKSPRIDAIERETTLGALPGWALEAVAAALPHKEDLVLPVALVSELDLRTRPGYALVTGGKQSVTVRSQEFRLWCVQVLHWGLPEMKLWFDDERRLVLAEYGNGQRAERVASEQAARLGITEK